jgi:hypothetical protein
VAAVAANDVWAVGSTSSNGHDYFTLVKHWDGTHWSVVPSPGGAYDTLTGLAVVAPNDIWAVGWALFGAEILHWNGSAWSISPTGSVGDYAYFWGVSAIATNDVWAFGAKSGIPLADHWTGTTWNIERTPKVGGSGNSLYAGFALAPDDVWAVGQSLDSSWRTLAMHWDGARWRTIKTPSPGSGEYLSNNLNGVWAAAANDIWAVGVGQQAMTLHFDGRRWREVANPGSQ